MTKEIEDEVTEAMESIKHFSTAYNDGRSSSPKEYEDDCCLHISRGKYRFCFYNGQDEGCLREKDLSHYAKMVDKIIIKGKKTKEEKKDCTHEYFEKNKEGYVICGECGKPHRKILGFNGKKRLLK